MNPSAPGQVSLLDFSQRLYPRELMIHIPLRLREYTFTGLLSPLSADVVARAGLYLLLAILLLVCAWGVLHLDLDARFSGALTRVLARCYRRKRPTLARAKASPRLSAPPAKATPFQPSDRSSKGAQWIRNELTLLHYSARMLAGRNLVATAMILLGLFVVITTYAVDARQTRAGVVLFQLELFAPLLGIVMFSDLVAIEFEARRADLLRASARGARWVLWQKLVHAGLFSASGCLALILALRAGYARFGVLHALGVVIPAVLFFGMIALVAASSARCALVGYAAGTAAMILSTVLKQVEPLTTTSFYFREHLANGRLLGDWNWLLAKIVFCVLACALGLMVLRLAGRPELARRILASSAGLILATYFSVHIAWSSPNQRTQASGSVHELDVRETDDLRIVRRAEITAWPERGLLPAASLVDVRQTRKGQQWQTESQTPVDLTKELDIPHLDLEVSVKPESACIEATARFPLKVLNHQTESVRFFLAAELEVQRVTMNGAIATFSRYADLVEVKLPREAEPGCSLNFEVQYRRETASSSAPGL